MDTVNLGKKVDYRSLEYALLKAAKDVGLKAKLKDKYSITYNLGSVKALREYDHTEVELKGKLFLAMRIYIYKVPTDRFYVAPLFASERKIKQYLDAVSRNL